MQEETRKKSGYAIAVAIVFALLAATIAVRYGLDTRRGKESVTFTRMLMGTVVELTLGDNGGGLDAAANAGFAEIERLEQVFSSYKNESDASRISLNAGSLVKVGPDTIAVLKKAVLVASLSKGAFDPTVGALAKVWGASGEKGVVPLDKEVEKLLPLIDWEEIIIDEPGERAGLARTGMSINLGGIAKGYIAWKAAEAIKAKGLERCIIKAGGDMYVFQDTASKREPFVIGIRHPRSNGLLGEVFVDSGAISTSGDYERFFEKDGVRYHHILDPKTGFPARKSMSVTIVSKDPTLGDALSTAVFVMGPVEGMALVESIDGVEGVIVDANGRVAASSGFKGRIF